MSSAGTTPPTPTCFRNISLISRLARFLCTAPPSFLDATIPRRGEERRLGSSRNVKKRPWSRVPPSNTALNSPRLRTRRALGNRSGRPVGGGVAPAGREADCCGCPKNAPSVPRAASEVAARVPGGCKRLPRAGLGGGNGEALTTLGAAPFEHMTAVLRRHPHQKAVRAPAAAIIGLKRAFALHVLGTPLQ